MWQDSETENYAFWEPGSIEAPPLLWLANASDGTWVHELTPSNVPAPPIQFFLIQKRGTFGPVLGHPGLVIFRNDLLAVLEELSVAEFAAYPATIRPPQSDETVDNYNVIKIPHTTPLAAVTTRVGRPVLSVARGRIDMVLVSDELRALLELANIPGLAFYEPSITGGSPAP